MWTNALRNRASVGSHVMANYARRLHSGMRGLGLCTRGIQSAYARIEPVAEELREAALTCAWVIQKDPAHADGLLQQTTQLRGIAGLRRFMGSIALDHDAIVPSSMRAVMDRASHCAQTVSIQSGLVLFLYGVADHAWYVEMVREVAALLQVSDAGLTARQVDTYASVREAGGDLCAQWIQQRSLRALQPACEVAAHCFAQWWMPTYPLGLSASTQSIAQHHTDREQFMEHNTSVLAYVSPYAMAHNDANGGPALALVGDHGVRPLHPLRARTAHSLEEHHAMSRWCQTALSIFDVMDPHVHWKYWNSQANDYGQTLLWARDYAARADLRMYHQGWRWPSTVWNVVRGLAIRSRIPIRPGPQSSHARTMRALIYSLLTASERVYLVRVQEDRRGVILQRLLQFKFYAWCYYVRQSFKQAASLQIRQVAIGERVQMATELNAHWDRTVSRVASYEAMAEPFNEILKQIRRVKNS